MCNFQTSIILEANGQRVIFVKKRKSVFRYGLGENVFRISGLYFFVWSRGWIETEKWKDRRKQRQMQVKILMSLIACSPPVAFVCVWNRTGCTRQKLAQATIGPVWDSISSSTRLVARVTYPSLFHLCPGSSIHRGWSHQAYSMCQWVTVGGCMSFMGHSSKSGIFQKKISKINFCPAIINV